MGQIRKRGRIWWLRYYVAGKRIEVSSKTEDRDTAVAILNMREERIRSADHCRQCGEIPGIGPRAVSMSWLRTVERKHGRLPPTQVLEMMIEQQAWQRLRKRSAG